MAEAKSSGRVVITPPAIAAYAFVFKPQTPKNPKPGEQPQFKLTLIMEKNEAAMAPLRNALLLARNDQFGPNPTFYVKSGVLNGDDEKYRDNPLYRGKYFIRTKTSTRPGIVGARRDPLTGALMPILPESEGGRGELEFYSGCICRASVYAYAYDTDGNKGTAFLLNNVQKLNDGERLSGRRAASDEFDEWTDEDSEGAGYVPTYSSADNDLLG